MQSVALLVYAFSPRDPAANGRLKTGRFAAERKLFISCEKVISQLCQERC